MRWQELFEVKTLQKKVVVAVFEGTYPRMFFSNLFAITKNNTQTCSIDLSDVHSDQDVKAQLEVSFLGQSCHYWLVGLAQLSKKKVEQWLSYVTSYGGPHTIFCVADASLVPKQLTDQCTVVQIPQTLDKRNFLLLFRHAVRHPSERDTYYVHKIFERTRTVGLDEACVLIQYLQVLGSHAQEFFNNWLDRIVVPEVSLFRLSQYFFARDIKRFLTMWRAVKMLYSEQFWISFWSDQMYRALFYCDAMHNNQVVLAKKIGFRLPFSFLQKDYTLHTVSKLKTTHQQLCDLDYALKNGGDPVGLDLCVMSFFA